MTADPVIGGLYRRRADTQAVCVYINPTNNVDMEFLYESDTFVCLGYSTLLFLGQVWYLQYLQDAFWDLADLIQAPD
jgi:hypothetical protein